MLEQIHRVLSGDAWHDLSGRIYPGEEIYQDETVTPKRPTPTIDKIVQSPRAPFFQSEKIEARKQEGIQEIQRLVGTSLNRHEAIIYGEAYRKLISGEFHAYCSKLVGEYHAGDCTLRQLLLRGALRASFSSKSALLHFATTGATGSGKNDLIENLTAILPVKNVVLYSSITSKVLYYAMRVPVPDVKNGWAMNPDHFRNKIICVTEIADSKEFSALKAFAELNEFSAYTHKTTSGQREMDLTVRGPRAVWITSVLGIKDSQANRRFIHSEIDTENQEKREARVRTITDSLLSQKSIKEDPRMRIARAGFDLLFASQPTLEPPTNEVAAVIADLNVLLDRTDHSPSQFKQLYALFECGAVLRQFERSYARIEMQDVLEGWWLSGFEIEHELMLGGRWCKPVDPMEGC